VRLKVRILEVDRSKADQLGINLFNPGGNTSFLASTTTSQYSSTATYSSNGTGSGSLTTTDPLNFLLYSSKLNLGATVKDLESKQVLQILAEPTITTISGKTADFLSGGEFPFPMLQPGANGGSVVTISFRQYGVKLEFTPIVNEDGSIRLKVAPEVSSLDYTNAVTIDGYTIPALATRRAETEVELRSDQSFAISGLLDQRTTDIMSKTPGVANIPILGTLFKSKNVNHATTELVVVVTPTLVNPLTDTAEPRQPDLPISNLNTGKFDKSLGKNLNPHPAAPAMNPEQSPASNPAPAATATPAPAATATPAPAATAAPAPAATPTHAPIATPTPAPVAAPVAETAQKATPAPAPAVTPTHAPIAATVAETAQKATPTPAPAVTPSHAPIAATVAETAQKATPTPAPVAATVAKTAQTATPTPAPAVTPSHAPIAATVAETAQKATPAPAPAATPTHAPIAATVAETAQKATPAPAPAATPAHAPVVATVAEVAQKATPAPAQQKTAVPPAPKPAIGTAVSPASTIASAQPPSRETDIGASRSSSPLGVTNAPASGTAAPPTVASTESTVRYVFDNPTATPSSSGKPAAAPEAPLRSMVQIMVLSNPDDAESMVAALKRHGYNAAVDHDSQDSLLHLEVGPFTSKTDAEAMRQRLVGDGYNAIVR
jgi:hypothetical protein